MARPEWRDSAKERFWRSVMRDWERSGLTMRAFCARRSLAEHNFHAWRRTLAERDEERRAPAFVPVEVVSVAAIEIELPGGAVVRVRDGADGATLRQVLAALVEKLSC